MSNDVSRRDLSFRSDENSPIAGVDPDGRD